MGLLDKVKEFIQKQITLSKKDDVLFLAVHQILTEDLGWQVKSFKMEGDAHEASYWHPQSPIHELEVEAERRGDKFVLKLEAETLHGEAVEDLLESFGFDIDLDEEIKVVFDLDRFVTDDLQLINEEELRIHLISFIRELERRVSS